MRARRLMFDGLHRIHQETTMIRNKVSILVSRKWKEKDRNQQRRDFFVKAKRKRLLMNSFCVMVLSGLASPFCQGVVAQIKQKPWTEAELDEARNWIPRASDTPPQGSGERKRVTFVTSRPVSNQSRNRTKLQRVNLAELKAKLAAQIGIQRLAKPGRPATSIAPMGLRHVGSRWGLGGGNLEGAGFSQRSPYEALAACSFSQYGYPVLYQGVARGRDGYFAYKIYLR